jgi:hypothetical protein
MTIGFAAWPASDRAVPQVRHVSSGGGLQKTMFTRVISAWFLLQGNKGEEEE